MSIANCKCGHPPVQADSLYRWPPGTVVSWCLDPASPLPAGIDRAHATSAIAAGFAAWPQVCSVEIEPAADPTTARVLAVFAPIDPTGVELGLTDLPAGQAQSLIRLNVDVQWTEGELAQVAMHEAGHALGLVHCTPEIHAVMNPIYQPDLETPTTWDVAQAVLRYPIQTQVHPDSLPSLALGRQIAIDATFAAAGENSIGLVIGGCKPVLVGLDVPEAGTYRLTLDFERAPG